MLQIKKTLMTIFFMITLLISSTSAIIIPQQTQPSNPLNIEDYDPNVDIQVIVEIFNIRSLEEDDNYLNLDKRIGRHTDPDFYVKIFINNQKFESRVWRNTKYLYDINWATTADVPDDQEWVNITIQLWDWGFSIDRKCDINNINDETIIDIKEANLVYNLKTGHWYGDDCVNNMPLWRMDNSGYGRLNGCDDGSFYELDERDCELWFNIYQTDPDGDRIPYWSEVNIYGTDPLHDDTGTDFDNDGIPIEWEHKWGHYFTWNGQNETIGHAWLFSDLKWNNHSAMDFDNDGLNNIEEYRTSQWDSDPYRKDVYVELDEMAPSPNGFESKLPEGSKELLKTVFNRRNIVWHLDDGCMGGYDVIPFQPVVDDYILNQDIYWNFFLHKDSENWRKGVFRYGVVVYCADFTGYCFRPNAWQISAYPLEKYKTIPKTSTKQDIVFGSAYMHECGHTLCIENPAVDDQNGKYPWELDFWKWRPYKSCMNYGYIYTMVDYSDGSRGKNDFNDWSPYRLDLTYFQ